MENSGDPDDLWTNSTFEHYALKKVIDASLDHECESEKEIDTVNRAGYSHREFDASYSEFNSVEDCNETAKNAVNPEDSFFKGYDYLADYDTVLTEDVREKVYETSDEDDLYGQDEGIMKDSSTTESLSQTTSSSTTTDSESQEYLVGKKRAYYGQETLTRKRQKTPANLVRNITKNATNKVQAYVSSSTKKYVPARTMKEGCGPGCENKCENVISENQRLDIFTEYWNGTTDQSAKYSFILRCVNEELKNSNQDVSTRRAFTRHYHFRVDNKDIIVCKTMFLATLDISAQVVDTALKKSRKGDAEPRDGRGRSAKRPRSIDSRKTDSVIEHINLFPRIESHFTRASSQREYLEEGLCIAEMHRLYTEWTKDSNKLKANLHHYTDTFNGKFNLGFFKPKKDLCDQCEDYNNADTLEKERLQAKHDLHEFNKKESQKLKELDADLAAKQNTQSSNDSTMICFDFQKVLQTPKSEASCLYYKRKLAVYNFTIYEVGTHKGFCYVWSEHEANRGSCEVASCLLDFIEKRANEGITNFTCYADNCGGQNKNKMVFVMLAYASVKFQVDIKLTFLETGHTQNEGDAVHATIEKYARGRKVFTEDEWCNIIRNAKKTGHKYEVINVKYDMIYDFKDLVNKTNWKITTITKNHRESSKPISILPIKQIIVAHESPHQLKYKTSFDSDYSTVILRKDKAHANLNTCTLKKLYSSQQGIKLTKLKDLLDLCAKNIIPQQYHSYYNSFTVKINENDRLNDIDEGEENE